MILPERKPSRVQLLLRPLTRLYRRSIPFNSPPAPMFDSLSDKLEDALKSVQGKGKINELNVAETMREVRRALLAADVNYDVARDFTARVKEEALGEKVLTAVDPGQQLVKIVYDELVHFMGGQQVGIASNPKPPTVILVAGQIRQEGRRVARLASSGSGSTNKIAPSRSGRRWRHVARRGYEVQCSPRRPERCALPLGSERVAHHKIHHRSPVECPTD